MTHTINGKPVENLQIIPNPDGSYSITYTEKFDLITAHMATIMELSRNNGIKCQVYKDLKHNYIMIWISDITTAHLLLSIFGVPDGCYEINKEDKIIVIQLKDNKYNTEFNNLF